MSKLFQMFAGSPSKLQEEVPSKTEDGSVKRFRRHSSNASQEEKRKKAKVSSVSSGNISEDEEESEHEHEFSDEEFSAQVFEDAPDWAKAMMEYLKQFTLKMSTSNKALCSKLNKLSSEFQEFKREKDDEKKDLENSLNFIQSQYDNLMAEKETLAARVIHLESKMDVKVDELEQYSRRSCLVITGFVEPRAQQEDTDGKVREFCRERLGVQLLERDIDRTHRLGPKRTDQEGKVIHRPIIVKFSTYNVRQQVFTNKKKLKGTGFAIFENLTKRNADLYKEVKTVAGFKNVWTSDGKIMTFNKDGKVFRVNSKSEISNVRRVTEPPDGGHL